MNQKQTILLVALLGMAFLSFSNAAPCEDTRCLECSLEGASICNKCSLGYKIAESACGTCDPSYTFASVYNKRCIRCSDSNCSSCPEKSDFCSMCTDDLQYTLVQGKCKDQDPLTAFTDVVGCEYSKTQGGCDRCNTNRKLVIDQTTQKANCQCDTTNGFVEKLVNNVNQCVPCTADRCSSCLNTNGKETCEKCQTGYIPDSTQGKCICATGYGLDATMTTTPQVCKPCSSTCLECSIDNRNICTKCGEGLLLINGNCKRPCEPGFGFQDGAGVCTACTDKNCSECGSNNFKCGTCKSGYIMFNNVCTLCEFANCDTCSVGSTAIFCKTCKIGFVKQTDATDAPCVASQVTCNEGTGLNANNTCEPCKDPSCTLCGSSSSVCATCKSGFVVTEGQCVQTTCDAGQGKDPTRVGCFPCLDKNCADCKDNLNNCLACANNMVKNAEGICATTSTTPTSCPSGQGFNADQICQACTDTNCSLCGESNTVCKTCKDGFFLELGKCTKCLIANCSSCPTSAQKCQKCVSPMIVGSDGQCVTSSTTCAEGTGKNVDNRCVACKDTNCGKCAENFEVCGACKLGFSLKENLCTATQICKIDGCGTCKTELACAKCNEGFFLLAEKGLCVRECPLTTGPNLLTRECNKCSVANCATCLSSFQKCGFCSKGYMLIAQKNFCEISTAPICQLANCSTCDATGVCSACAEGFSLGKVNGKQVCYKKAVSSVDDTTRPEGCSTLIANCSTCSVTSTGDIVCDACLREENSFCKEGNFILKKDGNFSACSRKFQVVECKLEGCAKCSVRKSYHDTCPQEKEQCLLATDGYQLVFIDGHRVAVLKDLTKYDNVLLKSPLMACRVLGTQITDINQEIPNLVCQECMERHILEAGKCRINDCFTKYLNCQACTVEKGCSECAFGFKISTTAQCVEDKVDCSPIPGCTICKKDASLNTLSCGACSEGYILKENKCEKCADCVATVTCTPNCGSCTTPQECTTCAPGFKNSPFCNECEKEDLKFIPQQFVCAPKCFSPQVYSFEKKVCTTPTQLPNCVRFATLSTGGLSCNQCVQGFGLKYSANNQATCQACTKGCLECQFDSTKEYCGTCAEGFTLQDNVCVIVSTDGTTTTPTVTVCEVTKTELQNCDKCYFQETKPICAACRTGFQLSNLGVCTLTCSSEQYLDSAGACKDCKESFCLQGCYLQASTSVDIASSIICREGLCIDGYYFDKLKMSCVQKPTDQNCSANQYFDAVTLACKECPKGCSGCSSAYQCTGCIEGFKYEENTASCFVVQTVEAVKTVTCLPNCTQCETTGFCLQCNQGFLLSEKKDACVTKRTTCVDGQFLKDNICVSCSEISKDCLKCVSKEGQPVCTSFKQRECTTAEMKIITGGESFVCVADKTCLEFDKENNCVKCLNGSAPVPMDANKPDSRKICKTCANANADGICITCPKNCEKCREETTTQIVCTACFSRFDLKEGACFEKTTICDAPLIRNTSTNRCECPYLSKLNAAGICECISGLVWNANKTEGCKKPEASDCEIGFRKEADGKCVACTSRIITFNNDGTTAEDYSPQFCAACTGDTCDRCREGSFLIKQKNLCHQCDIGCAACTETGKCFRCIPGKLLNNGVCKDACDAGTLPSIQSYFTMNKELLSKSETQVYQKTTLKADTTIASLEKCGEPLAIGEYTFCSLDTNVKLPFNTSPAPVDVASSKAITLECLPCRQLCKSCIAGLVLDPNGNKCVRECPLGFTAQKNDATGQITCAASVLDATKTKLETKAHLESRLSELVRGFTAQNTFQRTKINVKSTLPDQKLSHTLKLQALYLLGKGDEREQVPEQKLEAAGKEVLGELAAAVGTNVKVDENTIWLPANFLKSGHVYKFSIVTIKYGADGKTIQSEAVATVLIAAVERDSYVKLQATVAEATVANQKLFSLDKQCASLVIKDLVNYSKSDKFLVSISYRQAYVDSKDTMEPNQVTESTFENVFCFNAPYVQKETNFQVNFKLSFNGVHRTAERFFTVLPREEAQVEKDLETKLKQATDVAATTDTTKTAEKAIPKTQFIDLVSIITVKTEVTIGKTTTEVKPTDAAPTNTLPKATDALCQTDDPQACYKNGTCVPQNRVNVCECKEGYDPVSNCKDKWTTEMNTQITKANEQLLTVLKAANKQTQATVNSEQKLSDSVKVEITAKILQVPIKDVNVAKEAVKLLTTVTSSTDLPAKKLLDALTTAARTVKKLLRTTVKKTGGRFLTETEIDAEDKELDDNVETTLKKVADKLEQDNKREDTDVSEVTSEAFSLRVSRVAQVSDPKVEKIQQEIAAKGDNGKNIVTRFPQVIFEGKKNAAVRTFTQTRASVQTDEKFQSAVEYSIEVSEDDQAATGKRILAKVEVKNLEQPVEFCPDVSLLSQQAKPVQCRYLDKATNTWSTDGVVFNPTTKCCEAKHFSTFSIGTGDAEISSGTSTEAVQPTDGTGNPTTNPTTTSGAQPEAIGVNSNILRSIVAVFATIVTIFFAF